MNDVIREWIEKAEGDFATANREIIVKDKPNYDAVCFHAQQCSEKYFKALIIECGLIPSKVHCVHNGNGQLKNTVSCHVPQ